MFSWCLNFYDSYVSPNLGLTAVLIFTLYYMGCSDWSLDSFRSKEQILQREFDMLRSSFDDKQFQRLLEVLKTEPDPREWSRNNRKQLKMNFPISSRCFRMAARINDASIIKGANRYLTPLSVFVHYLGQAAAIMDESCELAYMYVTEAAPGELDKWRLSGELKDRVYELVKHAPVLVYNRKSYAMIETKREPIQLRSLDEEMFMTVGMRLKDLEGKPLPLSVLQERDGDLMPKDSKHFSQPL